LEGFTVATPTDEATGDLVSAERALMATSADEITERRGS